MEEFVLPIFSLANINICNTMRVYTTDRQPIKDICKNIF